MLEAMYYLTISSVQTAFLPARTQMAGSVRKPDDEVGLPLGAMMYEKYVPFL